MFPRGSELGVKRSLFLIALALVSREVGVIAGGSGSEADTDPRQFGGLGVVEVPSDDRALNWAT